MQIPRPIIHGVYALCSLGCNDVNEALSAKTVAQRMHVPMQHTAKILQAFAACDLVTAERGRGGGYRLARPLSEITVADVARALRFSDGRSSARRRPCPFSLGRTCNAYAGLQNLRRQLWELLEKENIATLVRQDCV